jgi:hypothetical protein
VGDAAGTVGVAGFADFTYDALGRRGSASYRMPDGCAAFTQSVLGAERDRVFIYDADRLLTELHFRPGVIDPVGASHYVYGTERDIAFALLDAVDTTTEAHATHGFWLLEDLDGRFIGVFDRQADALSSAGAEFPWFRPYPRLVHGNWQRFLRRDSLTTEFEGLGAMTYTYGQGFSFDDRANHVSDGFYAQKQYADALFNAKVQGMLNFLSYANAVLGFVPLVGDALGIIETAANLAFKLYTEGPSWSLAKDSLAAMGFQVLATGVGLVGPPGVVARGVVKGLVKGGAVKATKELVGAARGAKGLAQGARGLASKLVYQKLPRSPKWYDRLARVKLRNPHRVKLRRPFSGAKLSPAQALRRQQRRAALAKAQRNLRSRHAAQRRGREILAERQIRSPELKRRLLIGDGRNPYWSLLGAGCSAATCKIKAAQALVSYVTSHRALDFKMFEDFGKAWHGRGDFVTKAGAAFSSEGGSLFQSLDTEANKSTLETFGQAYGALDYLASEYLDATKD